MAFGLTVWFVDVHPAHTLFLLLVQFIDAHSLQQGGITISQVATGIFCNPWVLSGCQIDKFAGIKLVQYRLA